MTDVVNQLYEHLMLGTVVLLGYIEKKNNGDKWILAFKSFMLAI